MSRRNRSLRFLDAEWDKVTTGAVAAGQSRSEFVRDVLLRPTAVDTSIDEKLKEAVDMAGRRLDALAHEAHLRGRVEADERLESALDAFSAALVDIEALILDPEQSS